MEWKKRRGTKSDANKNENELKFMSNDERWRAGGRSGEIKTKRMLCFAKMRKRKWKSDERVTLKRLGEQLMITCWHDARHFHSAKIENEKKRMKSVIAAEIHLCFWFWKWEC